MFEFGWDGIKFMWGRRLRIPKLAGDWKNPYQELYEFPILLNKIHIWNEWGFFFTYVDEREIQVKMLDLQYLLITIRINWMNVFV